MDRQLLPGLYCFITEAFLNNLLKFITPQLRVRQPNHATQRNNALTATIGKLLLLYSTVTVTMLIGMDMNRLAEANYATRLRCI